MNWNPFGIWNSRGPPGGRHRSMGSSFNKVRWRYSYTALAHGRNGATLSASAMFFKSPSGVIGIFVAVSSTNIAALAAPQYPVFPGGAPNRTRPSGQRGMGCDGPLLRRRLAETKSFFPVRASTTEL